MAVFDDALRLEVPYTTGGDDFTVYIDSADLYAQTKALPDPWKQRLASLHSEGGSFEGTIKLTDRERPGEDIPAGRGLVCPCFAGQLFSVSIRLDTKLKAMKDAGKAHPDGWQGKELDPEKFLLSIADQCQVLTDAVFNKDYSQARGLLVVAAQTAAGKSRTVRAIIDTVLRNASSSRPHLVTFEDPIEKPYYITPNGSSSKLREYACNYTPRQRMPGATFPTMRSALREALRQTPTVFYIGEVRERRDWRAVFDFAGTGHLIITTTHAGSVTECMKKLLSAAGAVTAADRADLASKLLAVIHLRGWKHSSGVGVSVPALWRRTPRGVSELVANGLASILPYFPKSDLGAAGTLGRRWMVEQLLALPGAKSTTGRSALADQAALDRYASELRRTALEWDLEEM